jgi:hypothetical protein
MKNISRTTGGKPHKIFGGPLTRALPKPKPPTKMLTPAQKTWGTIGSGGGLDQLRAAAGISPKGMAVDTSINNPWLQAILTHIDNLVGAGQLSELQGNALKVGHLQNALPFLTGDNSLIAQGMIKQLTAVADTGVADEGALLAKIQAQVRAGDLTPEQGKAAQIASIQAALDLWNLSDDARLELRGELRDLTSSVDDNTATTQQLIDSNNALQAEVKKNNEFAQSVTATQLGTTLRAMADLFNGQIYGSYSQRSSTASSGQVARY